MKSVGSELLAQYHTRKLLFFLQRAASVDKHSTVITGIVLLKFSAETKHEVNMTSVAH